MNSPDLSDRFSRQTILPGVGLEGQKKWEEAAVVLAGEGSALEAAKTALEKVGLSQITLLNPNDSEIHSSISAALVVTSDANWRRQLNRQLRLSSKKVLFAWGNENGFSLFLNSPAQGFCPCLECFEVMNPKVFSSSSRRDGLPQGETSSTHRVMGAMAATEALLWILKGESPLEGKVWMTSFEDGSSFQHEVQAAAKCPAALAKEGVPTP